jgi:HKD family nuclease
VLGRRERCRLGSTTFSCKLPLNLLKSFLSKSSAMTITTQVLFERPQHEITARISAAWSRCREVKIAVGFATVSGIETLSRRTTLGVKKLETLVLGACTFKGFDALDRLISMGVDPLALHVHLGHSRLTGPNAKYPFYRYHPMLHSKVYYFEHGDSTSSAFIGSHNLTGFALMGMNGEASVLIEGDTSDDVMVTVRNHIMECRRQSIQYDATMKEAFSWWYEQAINGLAAEIKAPPLKDEMKTTVLVLAQISGKHPRKSDVIYLELPEVLHQVRRIETEFHVFLFDSLPMTPHAALAQLDQASKTLWCRVSGIESDQGGRELDANWEVRPGPPASIVAAATPFRPTTRPGYTQIRVRVRGPVRVKYEYLFDRGRRGWLPKLDDEAKLRVSSEDGELLRSLSLIPPQDVEWHLVKDLIAIEDGETDIKPVAVEAYRETAPASGNYVLISRRRRLRTEGS